MYFYLTVKSWKEGGSLKAMDLDDTLTLMSGIQTLSWQCGVVKGN